MLLRRNRLITILSMLLGIRVQAAGVTPNIMQRYLIAIVLPTKTTEGLLVHPEAMTTYAPCVLEVQDDPEV